MIKMQPHCPDGWKAVTLEPIFGPSSHNVLTRRKVGNETTSFVYDAAGQLTRVTLPDGARLTYTYDAAHRLTAIQDHKGNNVAYTLDAMGNRINEKLTDPGGVLVRNIARSIDALNRVQQVTGAYQ
jgi:YD repeat-containing protein